jgi:aminoglycoside phosphotransferase (APT) family kinase protein
MDEEQVLALVADTLDVKPLSAERMLLTHSGNTIYDVALPERHVIVRLRGSDRDTLSKTTHNIRALAGLGLPVPRIVAADTSRIHYPFSYVILEKIPGRDLLYELSGMTHPQMTRLAEQIVAAQRAVGTLPPGTGFGWGHVGEGGAESTWSDFLRSEEEALPPSSGVAPLDDFGVCLHRQRVRFQSYFEAMAPVCFLEDLTTKNILLEKGELQGMIDFDCVCFGDPLWMIGLAAGCIANDIGLEELFYIEELCRCWELDGSSASLATMQPSEPWSSWKMP